MAISTRCAVPATSRGDLVDTSLWVEVLRGRVDAATDRLRSVIAADPGTVAITEPIAMELLAGAPDAHALSQITTLVASMPLLSLDSARDFADAAALFVQPGLPV
jgi:predicted nucleic acid-binding protein